jgi:phosphohistidine phosphatase
MKTLHLMRHAKSSWQSPGLDDHDRELNERGLRDAPAMGRALAGLIKAQVVHCSSARRARQTLAGLCDGWPALGLQAHVTEEALYTFDYLDLMAWLQDAQEGFDSLFLLGHNPALTDLCNQLVGRPALDNLPTAGYLQLMIPIDAWSDVTEGIASLEIWQFPRNLPRDLP